MLRKYIYSEKSKNIYFDAIKKSHTDTAIIFLHGLCSSRRSWGSLYNSLSEKASLYFIDLLGFGFSAKPNIDYTLENHIAALKKFIDKEVQEKDIIFVGHSLGSIIALGYTSFHPERVKKAILIGLPYYQSREEAKKYAETASRFKFIFTYNLQTKILCTLVCSVFGSITRQISPQVFIKDLPKAVAQDGFRHSYQSYISTLTNVLYNQNLSQLLKENITKKLILIHGSDDTLTPMVNIHTLAKNHNLYLEIQQNANHHFPMFDNKPIIDILKSELKR